MTLFHGICFIQLKNTFKFVNINLNVWLLGLYFQYVKERSIDNFIPILRRFRQHCFTCPFLKTLHRRLKWFLFPSDSGFFSRIHACFRGFRLLFADSDFFSRIQTSFYRFKLLFTDSGFFSRIQVSFCRFRLLFADSSFFSRIQASSRRFGPLFADSSFFSQIRASFHGFGLLFEI